ncbi:unnamed protein product [Caenorhabditis brenneri]
MVLITLIVHGIRMEPNTAKKDRMYRNSMARQMNSSVSRIKMGGACKSFVKITLQEPGKMMNGHAHNAEQCIAYESIRYQEGAGCVEMKPNTSLPHEL